MEGTALLNLVKETIRDRSSISVKAPELSPEQTLQLILKTLDDNKAEDTCSIDLSSKSTFADYMVITSGRSQRHVGSMADKVIEELEKVGAKGLHLEGVPACDWVLLDAGDVIVHLFRPEVREFYKLEKLWGTDRPEERLQTL